MTALQRSKAGPADSVGLCTLIITVRGLYTFLETVRGLHTFLETVRGLHTLLGAVSKTCMLCCSAARQALLTMMVPNPVALSASSTWIWETQTLMTPHLGKAPITNILCICQRSTCTTQTWTLHVAYTTGAGYQWCDFSYQWCFDLITFRVCNLVYCLTKFVHQTFCSLIDRSIHTIHYISSSFSL